MSQHRLFSWKYLNRSTLVGVFLALPSVASAQAVSTIRVMTYNIWVGGTQAGAPLSRTVDVIQAAQADIIGFQERSSSGPALAAALGYNYQSLTGSTAILSRFPIVETLNHGVKLQLSTTQQAYIFDVHLAAYPYQPYDIRDGLIATEAQAIAGAQSARSMAGVLNGMTSALASGAPVFLTGDFNEPSHLDWTQEAADAGLNFHMKVEWPTSKAVTNAGLVDAFRELRPDEVLDRGETWTPGYPPPNVSSNEVHDRIDFVYYSGNHVVPTSALILGYDANDPNTDIAVPNYPSDHRAVVVSFDIPGCFVAGDITGDCTIDVQDWMQLRSHQHMDFGNMTPSQTYLLGDLNGDLRNNHADFVIFKNAYEAANGVGTFAQLLAVPEPSSVRLSLLMISALIYWALLSARR